MRVIILLFLSYAALCNNYSAAQDSTCLSELKTGAFKDLSNAHNNMIIRKDGKQIESSAISGMRIESEVTWLNETDYELTLVSAVGVSSSFPKIGTQIVVHITECNSKEYACTFTIEGGSPHKTKYQIL